MRRRKGLQLKNTCGLAFFFGGGGGTLFCSSIWLASLPVYVSAGPGISTSLDTGLGSILV
jgi:hypothetical protein